VATKFPLADVLGQRRQRTLIASYITMARTDGAAIGANLLSLARQRDWQLVGLSKFDGLLPNTISVAGAIVTWLPAEPEVADLLEAGVPTVRIGHLPHPDDPRVPAVVTDLSACGRIAAEHLAERGFKHVAIAQRQVHSDNESLFEAFTARAEQLGCHCHRLTMDQGELVARSIAGAERVKYEREVFSRWLAELPTPVGLLEVGDIAADRHTYWAIEAGLRVPEDVAVICVGNDEIICESALVPITAISCDYRRIAEAAVQMLERLMAGSSIEQTTVQVPPRSVVARRSTDVLAASDSNVAEALRFIWDHITEDLSVDQVAKHVGVSRRSLERLFHKDIGRGINAEFQRRRLERARELLVQTDLSIGQIAQTLSFSSQNYLYRTFRAAYGLTPSEYRQQH